MLPRLAAGLGYREEIAADLLRAPHSVDFVEVVAESCYVKPAARREAQAVAEIWPVIPHGVKLSLGAAEGIEKDRAKALGTLARQLRAPYISEHVAFVRSGSREIGHLTGLPLTRTAIAVVAKNVAQAKKYLPDIPLLLENIAWTFQWPESEMSEPDFYQEIAAQTGCSMLLDVGNLYANAVNSGEDPIQFASKFPLDRVAMIHLAGGVFEDAFYFDDHAHAVSQTVFSLLQSILEQTGPVPILIERDAFFPPFAELAAEVDQCRAYLRQTSSYLDEAKSKSPTNLDEAKSGGYGAHDEAKSGGYGGRSERRRLAAGQPAVSEQSPPSQTKLSRSALVSARSERGNHRVSSQFDPSQFNPSQFNPSQIPSSQFDLLQTAQQTLAALLVDQNPPPNTHFDPHAITRSRAILERKRVDEALPLLACLAPYRNEVEVIAREVVANQPRAPKLAGIRDALEIARRSMKSSVLRPYAERDLLSLEMRFVQDPVTNTVRPRNAPFWGIRPMSNGKKAFAFKGFGSHARVHVIERKLAST